MICSISLYNDWISNGLNTFCSVNFVLKAIFNSVLRSCDNLQWSMRMVRLSNEACKFCIFSVVNYLAVVVISFPEEYSRTHSKYTTLLKSFHKCFPLAVAREAEAHRADNRYLTIIQLEGSRVLGEYFIVPRCVEHIEFSKWVVQYQWAWYLLVILWYNTEQISMISWQ